LPTDQIPRSFPSLTVAGKSGDGEWLEKGARTRDQRLVAAFMGDGVLEMAHAG